MDESPTKGFNREEWERAFITHVFAVIGDEVVSLRLKPDTQVKMEAILLRFSARLLSVIDKGNANGIGPFHLIPVEAAEKAQSTGDMLVMDIAGDLEVALVSTSRSRNTG